MHKTSYFSYTRPVNSKQSLHMKILFTALTLLSFVQVTSAQKFLVLDRYGLNRERLVEGDKIRFKQKLNPAIFNDYVALLKDTSLVISTSELEIPLSEFETVYFQRGVPTFLQYSGAFVGGGFLFASAVYPLVSDAQYDQRESFIIGASFAVLSQSMRFFKWKKFKFNRKARIRIINTTYKKEKD